MTPTQCITDPAAGMLNCHLKFDYNLVQCGRSTVQQMYEDIMQLLSEKGHVMMDLLTDALAGWLSLCKHEPNQHEQAVQMISQLTQLAAPHVSGTGNRPTQTGKHAYVKAQPGAPGAHCERACICMQWLTASLLSAPMASEQRANMSAALLAVFQGALLNSKPQTRKVLLDLAAGAVEAVSKGHSLAVSAMTAATEDKDAAIRVKALSLLANAASHVHTRRGSSSCGSKPTGVEGCNTGLATTGTDAPTHNSSSLCDADITAKHVTLDAPSLPKVEQHDAAGAAVNAAKDGCHSINSSELTANDSMRQLQSVALSRVHDNSKAVRMKALLLVQALVVLTTDVPALKQQHDQFVQLAFKRLCALLDVNPHSAVYCEATRAAVQSLLPQILALMPETVLIGILVKQSCSQSASQIICSCLQSWDVQQAFAAWQQHLSSSTEHQMQQLQQLMATAGCRLGLRQYAYRTTCQLLSTLESAGGMATSATAEDLATAVRVVYMCGAVSDTDVADAVGEVTILLDVLEVMLLACEGAKADEDREVQQQQPLPPPLSQDVQDKQIEVSPLVTLPSGNAVNTAVHLEAGISDTGQHQVSRTVLDGTGQTQQQQDAANTEHAARQLCQQSSLVQVTQDVMFWVLQSAALALSGPFRQELTALLRQSLLRQLSGLKTCTVRVLDSSTKVRLDSS